MDPQAMIECQRRGDIVAVLLRLELAAVFVVVAHASCSNYCHMHGVLSG